METGPRCQCSPADEIGCRGHRSARPPFPGRGRASSASGPVRGYESHSRRRSTPGSPACSSAIRRPSSSARTSRSRAASTASRADCMPVSERRAFDTLLDETSILGLRSARPSAAFSRPEIQYRMASTTPRTSSRRGGHAPVLLAGPVPHGMVIRIAGYGYQRGFGGHFHNDDAIGVLRDIPGIVIASPARPDDAAAMLDLRRVGGRGRHRASSSNRSPCITPATSTRTATTRVLGADRWTRPARLCALVPRRDRSHARLVGKRAAHVAGVARRLRMKRISRVLDLLARAASPSPTF